MTLLTNKEGVDQRYFVKVGERVEEEACIRSGPFMLIWWGEQPIHESLLSRMIEEYNADALADAEFSTKSFLIPYIYGYSCAIISGVPVRRRAP